MRAGLKRSRLLDFNITYATHSRHWPHSTTTYTVIVQTVTSQLSNECDISELLLINSGLAKLTTWIHAPVAAPLTIPDRAPPGSQPVHVQSYG